MKLTNYARLSGRIPYQGHSQSDKPSAIFDHSLVRSMHVLSVLLFLFFFYNQKSANPYVFLVYTYLKQNNSRSTVDCKWGCICFSSSQRIIDSGHGMIISSFSKSLPFFFSNWIFHHDYEIKKKSVDVKEVFTQFQKNFDYRRSSRISG